MARAPTLDAVEAAVSKAGKGCSPMKLMSSSSQRGRKPPSRARREMCFLFSIQTIALKRDSKRHSLSVILMALIGDYAERLGVSRGSVEKFFGHSRLRSFTHDNH